jgi:hypothetical protein
VPRGVEYSVNGVWFDGYDPSRNVLVDAKDWVNYPPADTSFWQSSTLDEATRQAAAVAGTGTRVEWHVASEQAATALRDLLDRASDNNPALRQIDIRVVPKR